MPEKIKYKKMYFKFVSKFVSFSMYILMMLIAAFIFYKVWSLIYYLGVNIWNEIWLISQWKTDFMDGKSWAWIDLIENFLSNFTFILILVKAYRILEFYAKNYHIEIVDLVEIAIIALIMEVVFNFTVHSIEINILFGFFWVALLIIYAGMPYFRKKENNV